MKKISTSLIIILLILPTLFAALFPHVQYVGATSSENSATPSEILEFYLFEDITILRDGTTDLSIFINIPASPLAEIYRESLASSNASIEEGVQIPDLVKQEFFSALSKEYECSLGLNTVMVDSKMVPKGMFNEFRIYADAQGIPRSLDVSQDEATDTWTLGIGPMNSTIFAKCILTKVVFIQLLLEKLPVNQMYKSFSSTTINLPSEATLLNSDEISQLNWFADLGGGTSIEASLSVGEAIILNETITVTEQEITTDPAELCNALQDYKLFTIKYSLPHSTDLNIVKADNKLSENFDQAWGPISLVDKTFEASWSYESDTVSVEANVKAHVRLDVSGYVGWTPTFPWRGLQRFEAWTKAQARVDLTVEVSASAQVEKTFDLMNFDPISATLWFWIGWWPVEVGVHYSVKAELHVNLEGQLNVVAECRANAWLKAGVNWTNTDKWKPIWDHDMGIDQLDSTIDFDVKISVKPSLTNRLDIKFYEAAGPYVIVVLYAFAEIENLELKSMKIGLEVFAGVDFADQLKSLLGLKEWEWDIWKTILREWDFAKAHDVAISFVHVSKTKIYPGENVDIMVDVANLGRNDEDVTLALSYVDEYALKTLIERREFPLAKGVGLCWLLTWDTTGVPAGTYNIMAEASIAEDDDLTNNVFATMVELLSIDFYITFDYEKTFYKLGEPTETRIQVKNLRNVETTVWLGVSFHDPTGEYMKYQPHISVAPSSATLDPGQVANFLVTWTVPSDAPIGLYRIALNCYKDGTFKEIYKDNAGHADIFYVYKLNILTPTTLEPARAGDPDHPSSILVSLEWIPQWLLDPFFKTKPEFSIKINDQPASYELIDPSWNDFGIYTLSVTPPAQPNEGLYNLNVAVTFIHENYGELVDSDTESNAVEYVTAPSAEPIEKGLAWLRTRQYADGSWRSNVGVTSLALLAFLNAGYDETDTTVNKAINYILNNVRPDGSIYNSYPTYETSLAILPLVATRNDAYKTTIENAKNWLVNSQWDESCLWGSVSKDSWYYGGFGYGWGYRPDLSNSQFALLALDAAGLPKDHPLWTKAQVFLHRCQNINFPITLNIEGVEYTVQPYNLHGGYDGGFIYYPGTSLAGGQKSYGSMTGAGIWGLLLSGVPKTDQRVVAAMNWVRNYYTWDTNPGLGWSWPYYYYLSMSKALTMYGEPLIDGHDWYSELYDKLVGMQIDVGPPPAAQGYWSTTAENYDPDLTTAYAILSLQTRAIAPPVHRLSYLTFILRSNCHIRIIDPEGNLVGYNHMTGLGENQIPTAIYSGPFFEPQYIVIINPQAGTYKLELVGISEGHYSLIIQGNYGEDVTDMFEYTGYIRPAELHGSQIIVTAIVGPIDIYATPPEPEEIMDNIPPTTTLDIGEPKYMDPMDNIYVSSATPFTLTAEDDPGGTGVSNTFYRIYNSTYDTGCLEYLAPFYLTSLSDGEYSIDYYSTDNAGNVEPTNTATIILDNTGPSVTILNPPSGWALQDGVTFTASAIDSGSGVHSLNISIREANGAEGIPVGFEDLPATYNAITGEWTLFFDTLLLPDGYYVVLAKATDNLGNTGPTLIVPYSIRNWAVIELLPASETNKAGRTMPVKFALRVAASVDPEQPFVYNEDLIIKIYATDNPSNILQTSTFGDTARDYRINTLSEQYITNFQTLKTPKTYVVEIYRKDMLIGTFEFRTVK